MANYLKSTTLKAYRLLLWTACIGIMSFASCKTRQEDASLKSKNAKVTRQRALRVAFSAWGDVIYIDVGLKKNGDTCEFVEPLKRDASTRSEWVAMQIYWIILDKPKQVEWEKLGGTFFADDEISVKTLPEEFAKKVLGFLNLTEQHRSHFPMASVTLAEDKTWLTSTISSPINMHLQIIAKPTTDGCVAQTYGCPADATCEGEQSAFEKITGLYLHQRPWYAVYKVDVVKD